jgi:1,4-dihydroxy-2-naphthoyl-CoA synthase
MPRNVSLTPEQVQRRDELAARARYLGALLHPKNLAALRAEQGQTYRALMPLGYGREELADMVGLKSGKAVDWSMSKIEANQAESEGRIVVSAPEDMAKLDDQVEQLPA